MSSLDDQEKFPAANRVPIQALIRVHCPKCGEIARRTIKLSRDPRALQLPEPQETAVSCDSCGERDARLYLAYRLVLH